MKFMSLALRHTATNLNVQIRRKETAWHNNADLLFNG